MKLADLAVACVVILPGLSMVLLPARKRERHEARLGELRAGAPERYFEERRALETYSPGSDQRIRLIGLVMIVLGLVVVGAVALAG